MKKLLLTGLFFWGSTFSALASETAWVVHEQSSYVEMTPTLRQYADEQNTREFSLNTRWELGFLEHTMLVMDFPFRNLSQVSQTDSSLRLVNNGFTDLGVGLAYQILKEPVALSFKGRFKIPTGYVPEALPSLGDQQLDIGGLLMAGYLVPQLPVFIQGGLGYRYRSDFDPQHALVSQAAAQGRTIKKPADEVQLYFETGSWVLPSLLASVALEGQLAMNQEEALQRSQWVVIPKLGWRVNPYFDMSLQYERTLWVSNTPAFSGLTLGGHFRFGMPLDRDVGFRGANPEHAYYDANRE